MSLRSILRTDLQSNLTNDGDTVTLTKPGTTPTVYTVKGVVLRIDAATDPDTMQQFLQPRTAITISLADLGGNEPDDTWTISANDSEGNTKTSYCIDRMFDRTLGYVRIMMEDFS